MTGILDLSNLGNQSVTFSVSRSAAFDNTVDFYRVNADGSVVDPETGATIAPGEEGYAEAAIANRVGLDLSANNGETAQFSTQLEGGAMYASLIAVNSDFAALSDDDASNDPNVFFSYEAANIDGFDHVADLGDNQFGFEDLLNGGDEDFNDIVIDFELSAVEPPTEGTGVISGLKFNDLNGNGIRDTELVQGENPDVVFVIDVSGSTRDPFEGTPVGDVNDDGLADRILDAEVAAFIGLNQQLIDQGLGNNVDVGIVVYGSRGVQVDLNPSTEELELTTTSIADNDGNGISDVEDVLRSIDRFSGSSVASGGLGAGSSTDYEGALQAVEDTFTTLGTEPGDGNLVFLSDGEENGGAYEDEVQRLNDLGVNLSAFGVGEIKDEFLANLQVIDPDARIFTSTDQILNVFADLNNGGNGGENDDSQSTLEPPLEGVTIYLDTNNNGMFDEGEPSQVTDEDGEYVFEGLQAGTYTVSEIVPDDFMQTAPTDGSFTVTLGEDEMMEDLNFGNVSEMMSETEMSEI